MNDKSIINRILIFVLTTIEKALMTFGFVLIRNTPLLPRKRRMKMSFRAWDFNRYSSLEMVAHELIINNVPGHVAELGVFQGVFASKLNELFKDKKLYLFDTFQGFAEKDKKIENESVLSGDVNSDFSDTSVEFVLQKMKNRNNCIVKAGYFPDSAKGLEETFCFVSIDTDLYQPIYEGLQYFYPRLSENGYIFVHDFNNSTFPRAREAVTRFCKENRIGYFPLSDVGGTVVLIK